MHIYLVNIYIYTHLYTIQKHKPIAQSTEQQQKKGIQSPPCMLFLLSTPILFDFDVTFGFRWRCFWAWRFPYNGFLCFHQWMLHLRYNVVWMLLSRLSGDFFGHLLHWFCLISIPTVEVTSSSGLCGTAVSASFSLTSYSGYFISSSCSWTSVVFWDFCSSSFSFFSSENGGTLFDPSKAPLKILVDLLWICHSLVELHLPELQSFGSWFVTLHDASRCFEML